MNTLYIEFVDDTSYKCSFNIEQLGQLYMSVQSTEIESGKREDFLSVKFGNFQLLMAPMRMIKKYYVNFKDDFEEKIKKFMK